MTNMPSSGEPRGLEQIRAELLADLIDLEYREIGSAPLTSEQTQQLIARCVAQVEAMIRMPSAERGTKELICFFEPAICTMLLFVKINSTGRIHVRYWNRHKTLCGVECHEAPTSQEAEFSQLCLRCYHAEFEKIHRREQQQQQVVQRVAPQEGARTTW